MGVYHHIASSSEDKDIKEGESLQFDYMWIRLFSIILMHAIIKTLTQGFSVHYLNDGTKQKKLCYKKLFYAILPTMELQPQH